MRLLRPQFLQYLSVYFLQTRTLVSNLNPATNVNILLSSSPQIIFKFYQLSFIEADSVQNPMLQLLFIFFFSFLQFKTVPLSLPYTALTLLQVIGRQFSRMFLTLECLLFIIRFRLYILVKDIMMLCPLK